MSLWRVKHALSPAVEAALIGVVAAYGLFAIWYSSLAPMAVPITELISSAPQPVPLDIDAWSRRDASGFAFAIPPDWMLGAGDPAHMRLGRSAQELATAGATGEGILIETAELSEREEIANLASEDFSERRAATYDVAVDGRPSIFAISFENARVRGQAVYVPMGKNVLIIRSASLDPAVFAAFVSTIKFYKP